MKNQNIAKTRSDRPSGRQASQQPEHTDKKSVAPESLHQGQGPDFISQDKRIQEQNEGIQNLKKKPLSRRGPHQQAESQKNARQEGE